MTIIIGHVTPDELAEYNIPNFTIIKSICKLDKTKDYNIYILNAKINDIGLIQDTEIIIDELFISLKISALYYKLDNDEYICNASKYYGVKVCSLNE